MDNETLQRPNRIAKLRRDLAELRSRFLRIEHEVFNGKRQISELEAELTALPGGGW